MRLIARPGRATGAQAVTGLVVGVVALGGCQIGKLPGGEASQGGKLTVQYTLPDGQPTTQLIELSSVVCSDYEDVGLGTSCGTSDADPQAGFLGTFVMAREVGPVDCIVSLHLNDELDFTALDTCIDLSTDQIELVDVHGLVLRDDPSGIATSEVIDADAVLGGQVIVSRRTEIPGSGK